MNFSPKSGPCAFAPLRLCVRLEDLTQRRKDARRIALISLLLAVVVGCNKPQAATSGSEPAASERPPAVATARPERKALRRAIERPAFVEAIEETPLFARIPGYVGKIHVDFGDHVRGPRFDDKGRQIEPGQVLAELAVPEMEEELKQKQALV